MMELIEGAGVFIYPLAICSLVAVFIVIERLYGLLSHRVCPPALVEKISRGQEVDPDEGSALGRVVRFSRKNSADKGAAKAVARVEINRLERGLVLLEMVIGAAPLLGLLGTVTGLIQVFANISPETGLPEPQAFVEGVALALTTTVIGLSIAIPSLVANGYLQRRVETFAVRIESLIDLMYGTDDEA
jgi:biopolymer transport protein ExbB